MKKYCFAYYNKLGTFYGQPFFVDHNKEEFPKVLHQNLFGAKKEDLESLKEDDLVYLGEFDNETGKFVSDNEVVAVMSSEVADILVKKFGEKENAVKC